MKKKAPPKIPQALATRQEALHLQTLDAEARAYELRLEQKSYRDIAAELDISVSMAYRYVERATTIRMGDVTKKADAFRAAETARCFAMRLEIDVALAGVVDGLTVAKLVEADTKIGAHLAKLHGLNAPEKVEGAFVHLTYDEMKRHVEKTEAMEE